MSVFDALLTVAAMIGIIGPMVGVTWYSIRDEFHTPYALREEDSGVPDTE